MTDSPASPAPVRSTGLLRSPSPCLNLDALSSEESDKSAGPGDISAVPICISDDCGTPVNPDQVLSDEDLPTAACVGDRRQVIRIRDVPPMYTLWASLRLIGVVIHDRQCGVRSIRRMFQVVIHSSLLALWPCLRRSGPVIYLRGLGPPNLTPVVRADDVPQVGRMETIQHATPPDSVQISPDLPQTVAFDDMADSSMPLSPNCVQVGKSQDVPEKGTVFDISPVTPGFLMRLSGTAVQQPVACLPLPQPLCSEIR